MKIFLRALISKEDSSFLHLRAKFQEVRFEVFYNLEWSQMMRFTMSIKKDKLHPYYPYFRFEQFSFCTLSPFPSRSFVQMLSWIKIRTLRFEVMHPPYLVGWPF